MKIFIFNKKPQVNGITFVAVLVWYMKRNLCDAEIMKRGAIWKESGIFPW